MGQKPVQSGRGGFGWSIRSSERTDTRHRTANQKKQQSRRQQYSGIIYCVEEDRPWNCIFALTAPVELAFGALSTSPC